MAIDQIAHTPDTVASTSPGLDLDLLALSKETQASKLSVLGYAVINCSDRGCCGVKPEQLLGQGVIDVLGDL